MKYVVVKELKKRCSEMSGFKYRSQMFEEDHTIDVTEMRDFNQELALSDIMSEFRPVKILHNVKADDGFRCSVDVVILECERLMLKRDLVFCGGKLYISDFYGSPIERKDDEYNFIDWSE